MGVGGKAMRSAKGILNALGQVRFFECFRKIWALLVAIAVVIILIAVASFLERKADVKVVAAQIFETKIVIRDKGPARWHYFDYNLSESGSAILKLSNGACTNAPSADRAEGAKVTLRGKDIVTPRDFNQKVDALEVPIKLQAGTNRLGIRLQADAGKRISLRISAPADQVVLTPVINPVVVGRGHLRVQATVTGLGVPVRHAKMRFEVSGLEPGPKARGSTDRAGVATAFLSGFVKAGKGRLKAYVVGTDPLLSSEIPIQVVKAPAITLDHSVARLSVKKGDAAGVTIAVNVLQGRQQGYHVMLEHVIEPEPKGIVFESDLPSGGIIGDKPQQVDIRGKVTGIAAGTYTLRTTATIAETKDRWSDTLTIAVVDPDAADPLVLSRPSATPPAIPPGKAATVKFGAYVSGTRTPPTVLFLHEVDSAGGLKSPHVAELRDDGEKGDDHPDDLTYAGILNFDSNDEKIKTETTINYQLRAEHFGKTALSPVYTFHVTPLTVGIRPSDSSTLAKDPGSKFRLFSNEVVMGIHPGAKVDSKRAEEIASAAGGTVVGFWPPLRLYMVEIPVDPDADDLQKANNVRKAIEIISTFSEVEYAAPNQETLPLAFPFEAPDDPDFLCPAGTPATACQWYMETIGALMAWRIAGGGSTIKTALIEGDGTVDFSHDDLTGTAAGSDDHATRVAGLITAIADNTTGIAGVAYDSQLLSYNAYGASQQAVAVETASAPSVGARIINISQESSEYSPLETALDTAINTHDALVVIAAGQPANQGCPPSGFTDIWPAKYNTLSSLRDGLIAVGATDIDDNLAQWSIFCSNNVSWMDLYAPGRDIYSTTPGDSYAAGSGTSFATALTSGAAAVLWGFDHFVTPSGKTRAEAVHDRLIETAETKPALGLCDNGLDCGRLNLHAAVDTTEPYDIVFVLDRSGSMGGSTHISAPATSRWNALGFGVQAFTGIIGSTAPAGSRFGLTLFATNTLTDPLPSPLVNINRDLPDELPGILNDSGALGQIPSGLTAMGKGLQNARDMKLTGTSKPRIVVLFSDGEQNQAPLVDSAGCEFDDGTSINNSSGSPPACGDPGTIKVMTVGVGNPSGMYQNTLQNLAANNRGQYIVTSNGQDFSWSGGASLGDITAAFYSAIFPALSSSSPQMVAYYSGTLTNTITLPAFNLNKKVNHLMILFSFNRNLEINQLKRLLAGWRITKDGTDVTEFFEPVNLGTLTNSVLLKTNFIRPRRDPDSSGTAVIAPEGSYTVEMTLQPNIVPPPDFRVIPYADDHRLRMEWEVIPAAPRVHQSFTPTVRLSWLGSPVVNANVEAWILKPGDDLGDLLARNPQKIDPSSAPDAGSPGHQKYLHLIEKDPGFLAKLKSKEQRLTLTYQGGGQYSAPYEPGDVSGVYQILYRVNTSLPAFGEVERLAIQSVYTRFSDIDLAKSAVSTTVKGNTVTINFRPITTYGRFIGPAQGSAFSIDGTDTRLSNITDHQDGSYTLVLAGNPDAQVSIKLLGEEIYKGPASKAGKGFDLLVWLTWLIIILILLLLIWLIWRVI
jgi:hypothetical protein